MKRKLKIAFLTASAAAAALAAVFSVISRSQLAGEDRFDWPSLSGLALRNGYAVALSAVDKRLASHPNDALLYYFKARLYYEQGLAAEALKQADAAIKFGYAQEVSYLLKALVSGRLKGDYAAQLALASKALSFDPTYGEGYLARAEAEYVLGKYKACAADASSFSSLSPGETDGYEYSLLCLEGMRDYTGAEAAGFRILSLKPRSHAALWRLGRIYAGQGLHKRAIGKFTEAIAVSGGRAGYFMDRARSCEAEGDFSCAARDYASAMGWAEISGYASYYYLLGSAMHRAGELKYGLKAAGIALEKEPENPDNYELRGRLRADLGDVPGAKKDFLKLSVLSPSRAAEAAALIRKLKSKK